MGVVGKEQARVVIPVILQLLLLDFLQLLLGLVKLRNLVWVGILTDLVGVLEDFGVLEDINILEDLVGVL